MAVDTKHASNRRSIHYNSVGEILADAEILAAGNPRTVGNWTYGQILGHLAHVMNIALDGTTMKLPAPIVWIVRTFLKKRLLEQPMSPGRKLPKGVAKQIVPPPISTEVGLKELRKSMSRWQSSHVRHPSPFLGELTNEEWDKLTMRHAELHMSFVHPQ